MTGQALLFWGLLSIIVYVVLGFIVTQTTE